jgi:hypothetical protein
MICLEILLPLNIAIARSHSKPDLTISTAGYCDASSTKIELSLNNIGGAATQGYQEIQVNGRLI